MGVFASAANLTNLLLEADTFPEALSALSCLKLMKQLQFVSSDLADTGNAFVCDFQHLRVLERFSLTDNHFMQIGILEKLTTLNLSHCSGVAKESFLALTGLISLREFSIRNCHADVPQATIRRMLSNLGKLQHISCLDSEG